MVQWGVVGCVGCGVQWGVGWGGVCYCTVLNSFAEHRTQYSTGRYSTVQYSTVQYSIIQSLLDHGRIEI